jgi:putative acid phosphatase of HAD superfamily subfamily IIIB
MVKRIAVKSLLITTTLVCFAFSGRAPAYAQPVPSGCQPPPQVEPLDLTAPINIGLLKPHLDRYRCIAYDDDVKATLAQAHDWLAAHVSEFDKPALVLDIDETSLSNWEQIYHNDFAYIPSGACDLKSSSGCGQREWELSASAAVLQPTLELFNFAKTLKGRDGSPLAVFFVTGRYEDPFERLATEWNLRRVGYDQWQQLYMRPDATRSKLVSAYKKQARADIEDRQRYTIVSNIGDQFSDLVGGHAQKCFKVPNPFYFIPGEPLPTVGLTCLASAQTSK